MIHIIGGGLAGSEAAWQAAQLGVPVTIHEMRPVRPTAVHKTDGLAELVCSNSFRGDKLDNAVGLLKEEMRRLGSLVMQAADAARVPAGAALAVDRVVFSTRVTDALSAAPADHARARRSAGHPGGRVRLVARHRRDRTADVRRAVGRHPRVRRRRHLYFYDAISPIVLAETSTCRRCFGPRGGDGVSRGCDRCDRCDGCRGCDGCGRCAACGVDDGQGDYLNCPMTQDEYDAFYQAIIAAESATVHDFDKEKFFEGCLPIEVMAHRGPDTLRFGPMKPVGLTDPRTGRFPYAVVQLRQDTLAGDHFSLVGFQTQLKWGEQARVLRMIPGLEQAEFVRFGMVHRNTYINGPTVLHETWQTRTRTRSVFRRPGVGGRRLRRVGGLGADCRAQCRRAGARPRADSPPRTTAIGALAYYVSHADAGNYQPSNITHGIMAPLDQPPRDKLRKKMMIAERALPIWTHGRPWAALSTRAAGNRQPAAGRRRRPRSGAPARLCRDERAAHAFLEYLHYNRNASDQTIRAYESDITQYLAWLATDRRRTIGALVPADLDTSSVRLHVADSVAPARPAAPWRARSLRFAPSFAICDARGTSSTIRRRSRWPLASQIANEGAKRRDLARDGVCGSRWRDRDPPRAIGPTTCRGRPARVRQSSAHDGRQPGQILCDVRLVGANCLVGSVAIVVKVLEERVEQLSHRDRAGRAPRSSAASASGRLLPVGCPLTGRPCARRRDRARHVPRSASSSASCPSAAIERRHDAVSDVGRLIVAGICVGHVIRQRADGRRPGRRVGRAAERQPGGIAPRNQPRRRRLDIPFHPRHLAGEKQIGAACVSARCLCSTVGPLM